jgi:hypothetical protein
MGAAAMLSVALGGDELDGWLAEQAEVEGARNIDVRPFADAGWTASAILHGRRAHKGLPGTPLSIVPWEGADQPMLKGFDEGDVLMLWVQFAIPPEPAQHEALMTALGRGDEALAARGVQVQVEGFDDPLTLQLCFGGAIADPALIARTYLAELQDPKLEIREVLVARFLSPGAEGEGHDHHHHHDHDHDHDHDEDSHTPSLQAVDDPRASTEHGLEGDDWWNASFDPKRTPPASEPESGLFMMVPSGEGYAAELRLAATWFPDLRVAYGLTDVEYVSAPRKDAVQAALAAALAKVFRGAPPSFRNTEGQDGTVDGIESHGRLGYGLAIPQLTPAMVQHLPRSVRFREHELFVAMREVVQQLGLAPVVHWYRGDGLYVVKLWEA